MEYNYWDMFNNNSSSTSTGNSNTVGGHNGNFTTTNSHAWDQYSTLIGTSSRRVDWSDNPPLHNGGGFHAPVQESTLNGPQFYKPDPHLMCLKLGKRHYFENHAHAAGERHVEAEMTAKKGKPYQAAAAARCQVEGCEVVLVNAKEYHRRHKVCEIHAKAPKVVVLGIEQRFCQQCSRFHGVGEFDEAKRSCRRRLAGHNERRRKTSQDHQSLNARKYSQGTHPHFLNSSECALSLLSSSSSTNNIHNNIPWNIPAVSSDLPAKCTAALHELIAENRASILAYKQQINSNQIEDFNNNNNNNNNVSIRPGSVNPGHVMQDPNLAFGFLSMNDCN